MVDNDYDYHLLSREQQVVLMGHCTGCNSLNSHMHCKLKLASSPTYPVVKNMKPKSNFSKVLNLFCSVFAGENSADMILLNICFT